MPSTPDSSQFSKTSVESVESHSLSSVGTEVQGLISVWVEHHGASTSMVGRLTFPQGVPRWLRRTLLALLGWALTVTVGPSTWTFVQGLG